MRRAYTLTLVAVLALSGCSTSEPTSPAVCAMTTTLASSDAKSNHASAADQPPRSSDRKIETTAFADPPAPNPRPAADRPLSNGNRPVSRTVDVILPSTLYLTAGTTYELFFAKFIRNFNSTEHEVAINPLPGGSQFDDHWQYTPATPGAYTFTVTVRDRLGVPVASVARPIIVKEPHKLDRLRILAIGDSITRSGIYAQYASVCNFGGTTVGTRTYDSGIVNTEGRGGWGVNAYATRIAHPDWGDSPFVFPKEIPGDRFRGNTSFWRDVTQTNSNGYNYEGFQKIARNWMDTGPYTYNSRGYPALPQTGDVIVDPSQPAGGKWMQFDGNAWRVIRQQIVTEISFEKYLARFAPAFDVGLPTLVTILLGTNDFMLDFDEKTWTEYRAGLSALVESIHSWNPDVPVILLTPPTGGPDRMWEGKQTSQTDFDSRMMELSARLFSTFDNVANRQNRVYVASFLGVLADSDMADYVHPKTPEGQVKLGQWLSGMVAYLGDQSLI